MRKIKKVFLTLISAVLLSNLLSFTSVNAISKPVNSKLLVIVDKDYSYPSEELSSKYYDVMNVKDIN